MKKILFILSFVFIIAGCSLNTDMDNTPTKQVEAYLNNYQTLNSNVLEQLDSIVESEVTFNEEEKETYRDILKKHYQDLTYEIKEETINGDKATVEVEIEVNDYSKTLKDAENYKITNESEFMDSNKNFDNQKYNDYKLDLFKKNDERVTYTLYMSLSKINNKWVLDDLTKTEEDKLLGIYEY